MSHPMTPAGTPYRQIRAQYDDDTITVYQAYKATIADAAVAAQKLNASPEFRPGRMTWIKPSWCWMMYRAGYSYKDPRQERILALKMKRQHFIDLLERGVLSTHVSRATTSPDASVSNTPNVRVKTPNVRIQWDPERGPGLELLPYRSIQIGVPGALSDTWVNEWIVGIEDVTEKARGLKSALEKTPGISTEELRQLGILPTERPFLVPDSVIIKLDMTAPKSSSAHDA